MQDAEQQPAPQIATQAAERPLNLMSAPLPEAGSQAESSPQTPPTLPLEGSAAPGVPKSQDGQKHKRSRPDKSKNFQRRNKPQHGANGNGDRGLDRNGENDEGADDVESNEPLVVVPLDSSKPGASRQGQTWTLAERQQVSNAYREGMSIGEISFASGRSEFAVACHLEYAGLLGRGQALQYTKKTAQTA